jgi:hypothetical protein
MVLACTITIDGKEDAAFVLLPHALYLLSDKSLARVSSHLVWCDTCGDFSAGEHIEPISSIETRLSKSLSNELPEYHSFIFRDDPSHIERFRASMKRTLHWMGLRQSPAKCLTCGSTRISPVCDENDKPFADNKGRIVYYSNVFASTAIDHRLTLYDTECNSIAEISRICPDSTDFIDDDYPYDKIIEILGQSPKCDRTKRSTEVADQAFPDG